MRGAAGESTLRPAVGRPPLHAANAASARIKTDQTTNKHFLGSLYRLYLVLYIYTLQIIRDAVNGGINPRIQGAFECRGPKVMDYGASNNESKTHLCLKQFALLVLHSPPAAPSTPVYKAQNVTSVNFTVYKVAVGCVANQVFIFTNDSFNL